MVTSAPTTAPVEQVTSQAANCPKGTTVPGGGAYSSSPATDVYINSTVPNQLNGGRTAWRVAMANADPYTPIFTVYAVCRPRPAGYSVQYGYQVANGPYSEAEAVMTCPGTSVPIGGGGFVANFTTDKARVPIHSAAMVTAPAPAPERPIARIR